MRLATTIISGLGAALMISAGGNTVQFYKNAKQEMLLDIEVKRNQINTDQINEFILNSNKSRSSFMDPSQDVLFAENQGYIRGIMSVVAKASPQESEISAIWHNGYERGMSQTDFVGEMQYEKGYQSGFNVGQKDTMKALSTIMKSGDNIQNAIKDFVDQQGKKIEDKTESKQIEKPSK